MEDEWMKSELLPSVQAVAEFMPPKKNGIFEKSMEVARLLLEHEPVSIIAHTVDGAIQNYGMVKEMKYRAKAIKYVTHLEEVRINAQVEMARLQNQNIAMRLYIDRSFQQSLDYMEDAYLSQSYRIDQTRRQMIQEVNNQVQRHFGNIDRRYIETVREFSAIVSTNYSGKNIIFVKIKDELWKNVSRKSSWRGRRNTMIRSISKRIRSFFQSVSSRRRNTGLPLRDTGWPTWRLQHWWQPILHGAGGR